jgi:cell division protein FtsI/penicillin-binding protein 2
MLPRVRQKKSVHNTRIGSAGIIILLISGIVVSRLFFLMVVRYDFYTALAAGTHEVYAELFPERGKIFMQDSRTQESYPVAMNRDYYHVYIDTRQFTSDEDRSLVTSTLTRVLSLGEVEAARLDIQAKKINDPYEPVMDKVSESLVAELRDAALPGVGFIRRLHRFYPEGNFAGPIIGFVGKDEAGRDIGRYGIEGHFETILAGSGGFFSGKKTAKGLWIPTAGRSLESAVNGADIYTTIDRNIQYYACKRLYQGMIEYAATSASLVMMHPRTGAILAMCSIPEFDPNEYGSVRNTRAYQNDTIFVPYEVGSIFKPIVMAFAINEELVTPDTYFYDSGSIEARCSKPIQNANFVAHKDQTMTGVLEQSINTGMVYITNLLGKEKFVSYMERLGFGLKTSITLDTEAAGTIASLYQNKGNTIDCYTATASFGQGFTATPLQMVTAYSALANGGKKVAPYIVEKIVAEDGKVTRYHSPIDQQVFTNRTSHLLTGMMVSTIDNGYSGRARAPGYAMAGKSGTAQIAGVGGYTAETNHSFIGYGPAEDPQFILIVKFEKPRVRFAESSAAPVFGDISLWTLQYLGIPRSRQLDG